MAEQFPFAFDFSKFTQGFDVSGFNVPGFDTFFKGEMPTFDFSMMQEASRKNMAALMEANKKAVTGYQALYKRQAEIFEAAVAEAKDRMSEVQGQPMTAEAAAANFETMKAAFDKGLADLKEIAEMAHSANTDAFDIIKARTEEAFAEMKDAAEKMAA
ncbi:MAG: phasin family protein [Pseudomonadota bacterium]